MSIRTERREAERLARKLAYQQMRQAESTASPAQIEANRANALQSTGPVTPEGKAVASRNRTTHGLTAEPNAENFQVLPTESQPAYDQYLAQFQDEWKPATATEHDLVHRLVMHKWLRLRAMRLQESLFCHETGELTDVKKFDLYRRYETTHERGFNKCLADLQRLRAFQSRQQIGFESQKRKNEEHALKMSRLQARLKPESEPAAPPAPQNPPETSLVPSALAASAETMA